LASASLVCADIGNTVLSVEDDYWWYGDISPTNEVLVDV
jgi:hypothetical protein